MVPYVAEPTGDAEQSETPWGQDRGHRHTAEGVDGEDEIRTGGRIGHFSANYTDFSIQKCAQKWRNSPKLGPLAVATKRQPGHRILTAKRPAPPGRTGGPSATGEDRGGIPAGEILWSGRHTLARE